MATKDDFSPEDWAALVRAPLVAGLAISIADPGGPIELTKESMAAMKTVLEPVGGDQPELVAAIRADFAAEAADHHSPVKGYKPKSPQEIVDELKEFAARSIVLRKRRYSGFYGTDLERVLTELAPERVEVVGVCTDICVLHTVAGLRDRDYPVTVRSVLVATYDAPGHPGDEAHRWALAHMRDILGAGVT